MVSNGVLLLLLLVPGAYADGFMAPNRRVQLDSVRDELRGVLSDVLGHGHGVDVKWLAHIQSEISPLFHALPKTQQGHLSPAVMRYVVQRYFSQRRGWIMKGFERHAVTQNASDLKDGAQILHDKVPDFIRTVLEEKLSHEGFALQDAVAMIASLERLVLDEVTRVVQLSFEYNFRDDTRGLDHDSFLSVLSSYLIMEMSAQAFSVGSVLTIQQHQREKRNIRKLYPHWDETFVFLSDIAENDGFLHMNVRNPFVEDAFFFDDAVRISQRVSEEFGQWSNHECDMMKSALSAFDTHATGRVRMADFYGKHKKGGWQFEEGAQYLGELGAIDDSSTLLGPQVIIANYVTGMNNCITSTPYYSICCLNECDDVYQRLESVIHAPYASPSDVFWVVDDLLQERDGKNLSATLRARLEAVASFHDGKVPIHGRLLAQWLHFAFPRDCPYPHMAGSTNPQHPARFEAVSGRSADTTDSEVEEFLRAEPARLAPSPDAGALMWNLHEVLLDPDAPSDAKRGGAANSFFRLVILIVMVCSFGGFVLKESRSLAGIVQPVRKTSEILV